MHARAHFNPCHLQDHIYLLGGCTRDSIELFYPSSLTIRTLGTHLPSDMNSTCVVFAHDDELCVLTEFNYLRYQLRQQDLVLLTCTSHHNNWKPSPNSQPVIYNHMVYIIKEQECSWCELLTGKLVGYH